MSQILFGQKSQKAAIVKPQKSLIAPSNNLAFLYLDPFRCDRAGLAGTIRLAAVRCPAGLAFDINRQTCDWKAKVENCDRLSSMYRFYFEMWQLSAQLYELT